MQWTQRRRLWAVRAAVLLAACVSSLVPLLHFVEYEPGYWSDENGYLDEVMDWADATTVENFEIDYYARRWIRPLVGFRLLTLPFRKLFDDDGFATWGLNSALLALLAMAMFEIARSRWGLATGFGAAVLVLFDPLQWRMASVFWPHVTVATTVAVGLWLLSSHARKPRLGPLIGCSAVVGVALLLRPGFPVLFLGLPMAVAMWHHARSPVPRGRPSWRRAVIAAGALALPALVVAGPWYWEFAHVVPANIGLRQAYTKRYDSVLSELVSTWPFWTSICHAAIGVIGVLFAGSRGLASRRPFARGRETELLLLGSFAGGFVGLSLMPDYGYFYGPALQVGMLTLGAATLHQWVSGNYARVAITTVVVLVAALPEFAQLPLPTRTGMQFIHQPRGLADRIATVMDDTQVDRWGVLQWMPRAPGVRAAGPVERAARRGNLAASVAVLWPWTDERHPGCLRLTPTRRPPGGPEELKKLRQKRRCFLFDPRVAVDGLIVPVGWKKPPHVSGFRLVAELPGRRRLRFYVYVRDEMSAPARTSPRPEAKQ